MLNIKKERERNESCYAIRKLSRELCERYICSRKYKALSSNDYMKDLVHNIIGKNVRNNYPMVYISKSRG